MAEIDLTPTEEMAANAARGLELRRKHGKGGTEIGVARARDISNRKNLSPETVRRMHAFFSRHEKNKAGGEDDAGYIAWLLWGGDSGQSWAKRKVEQMDKGENQRSDTYKEIAQRLGSAAKHDRPGAKAKFAVSITGRRGRQPGIPGGWLTGTWDGGKWAALVFAEASAAEYGLPEFRNISKFWIADKQGKTIVNYDRGWDVKPATPEARQAFMEIGRVASAEASKMPASRPGAKAKMAAGEPDLRSFRLPGEIADVRKKISEYTRALDNDIRAGKYTTAAARCKAIGAMYGPGGGSLSWFYEEYADALKNRGYSRSGTKAKFAQPPFSASDLNALKRLVKQYEQQAKASKGKQGPNGENLEFKALSIAGWMQEMINYAQSGQTHRAYSIVRTSNPDYVRFLPPSLVKAAWDVTKMSRPGAKAKMAKWTVVMPSIPDAGTRHFDSWEQAKNYVDTKMGGFTALVSVDGKRYALKHALGQWEKYARSGAKVANAVREGEKVSAADDAVSRKIRKLMDEGKPQKQAVAIALDLERRGEL